MKKYPFKISIADLWCEYTYTVKLSDKESVESIASTIFKSLGTKMPQPFYRGKGKIKEKIVSTHDLRRG